MRLFVAAWPSEDVRRHLRAVERPETDERDGLRWTPEERWHVTLRFLGDVDDAVPVIDAVAAGVAGITPPTATLGPHVERLGAVAAVPVTGLDALATTVIAATAHLGQPPDDHPFHGHITVARARGRARLPATVISRPALSPTGEPRSWSVESVAVVRSILGPAHRYDTQAEIALTGSRPGRPDS